MRVKKKESALDITLEGAVGTFKVDEIDSESKNDGIEVKYILTHVSLSENNTKSKLLSLLAPVREVFDLSQLGVDELMQRDIEDSRVSLELIPYLLDKSNSGLIKLFPPIVAIVLPLKPNSKEPDNYYKEVSDTKENGLNADYQEHKFTAGRTGEEQFQFIQYYQDENLEDNGTLKLSRDNSALAIVDGQHRAMALLALYRNLNQGWADANKSPYEEYYKVWPSKQIRKYDLSQLQLPVMICTFPKLDKKFKSSIDVIRAARKVFLTLNKSAKTVSDSRNKLLNDQDITSECLRETLNFIKDLDLKDDTSLRIWNVELDQEKDKTKIVSDVAFTGVSHLYTLIDQVILGNFAYGIEPKNKSGAPKKRLDESYIRLNLADLLKEEQKNNNTKFNYSDEIKIKFRDSWRKNYIPLIIHIFSKLEIYSAFTRATLQLKNSIVDEHESRMEKILFDGQAARRIFDDFISGIERRVTDGDSEWNTPEINDVLHRSKGVINKRNDYIEKLGEVRASFLFEKIKKSKFLNDEIIDKNIKVGLDKIYNTVFSTVAFQTALIATFSEALLRAFSKINPENIYELLDEYVKSLNIFFKPKNDDELIKFFSVFEGELKINEGNIRFDDEGKSFRDVILSGEMQPSEWPKFRYLFLELWNPTNKALESVIEEDRLKCRIQVYDKLVQKLIRNYCKDNGIAEIDLGDSKREEISVKAKNKYENFLKALGAKDPIISNQILKSPPEEIDDFELEQA
ncbi:DNA sulfur modification protein DndB [uncultured Acinetobacter sp.]|uniref:DNA sulfur modification protein DndB n=1 Tax=uncultured Acinetobacter sp. TaxID=165433 RepID=UPI002590B173|nr:DNA sulfur modification protein DndB [uncultured Acinetobacter sp.]